MPRPLCDIWNHFRMMNDDKRKKHVVCLYCSMEYKVGNATRMTKHILSCKSSPRDVKDAFAKRKQIYKKRESVTSLISNSNSNVSFDNSSIIEIPAQTSRKLSSSDSRHWTSAENEDDLKMHVSINDITHKIKEDKGQKRHETLRLSLVCHGWVDDCGKGIINLIVTTPKPIYFITLSLECELEPGEYIGQKIIDVIEEFGSTRFTAIVANTDSTMKQAWRLVKSKYPQISCIGCISYGINLLCGDLLKIEVFKTTVQIVFNAISHIQNNEILLELFEKQQIEHYGSTKCTLKLPSKTRLIGVILALNSFKSNKDALETLVKSKTNPVDSNIKKDISNEVLWFKIDETLNILQVTSEILQSLESEKATLSDVPAIYSNLCNAINDQLESNSYFSNNDINKIKLIMNTRKNIVQPIHLAANLLDPRYRGAHLEDDTPIATEFISECAAFLYHNDQEKISQVLANIANFKTKTGYYGKSNSIWMPVQLVPPSIWWHTFASREIIAPIAIRLLSVPPSSAGRHFNSFEVANIADNMVNGRISKSNYFRSGPSNVGDQNSDGIPESVKKDESFEFIETETYSEEE